MTHEVIDRQNFITAAAIKNILLFANQLQNDPELLKRKEINKCRYCHYNKGKLTLNAFKEFTCECCKTNFMHPNYVHQTFCKKCAEILNACKECGASLNI